MSLPFIAGDVREITPSDSDLLDFGAIYIGGFGSVSVVLWRDDHRPVASIPPVTFVDVPAGTFLPIRVRKVLDTGTDATNILGLNP